MEESHYYNAVAVAKGGDPMKIAKARKGAGSWKAVYEKMKGLGAVLSGVPDAYEEWRTLEKSGVRLVLDGEREYPAALREIPDPPLGLYIRGAIPAFAARPVLAIVGTRRATPEGKNLAKRFARELAQAGFVIVSGLAFGIDAAAHEGCLEGGGTTLAVLAGGLNDVYPHEHAKLAEKILANGGGIISEYPLGSPPYPGRFLERNRIVSGLARGILIVEAPDGSGALATARDAAEQNKDLFVLPGSVLHPNFAGSHQLIRQGATLVTTPEEIFEAYSITRNQKVAFAARAASAEEKQILEALQATSSALDVDKITAATKLEPRIVSRTISFLLLRGLVKEEEGGYTI